MQQRKFESARNVLDEVREGYENSPKIVSLKAICLMEEGELKKAHTLMSSLYSNIKDASYAMEQKEQCLVMLHKIEFRLGKKSQSLR